MPTFFPLTHLQGAASPILGLPELEEFWGPHLWNQMILPSATHGSVQPLAYVANRTLMSRGPRKWTQSPERPWLCCITWPASPPTTPPRALQPLGDTPCPVRRTQKISTGISGKMNRPALWIGSKKFPQKIPTKLCFLTKRSPLGNYTRMIYGVGP